MTTIIIPSPESPEHPLAPQRIEARQLLQRIEPRIRDYKRALAHRHDDAAWWTDYGITAPDAQERLSILRRIANLLNVDRATRRGKLHGFATMEEQQIWLRAWENHTCARAAWLAGVDPKASLVKLRAGEVLDAEAQAELAS